MRKEPYRLLLAATALIVSFAVPASADHEAPRITSPETGQMLPSSNVRIEGTAAGDAASVRVLDGGTPIGETGVREGWWRLDAIMADGAHAITAIALTAGGAPSPASSPVHFSVDTLAPAAPSITSPPHGSILGFSAVIVRGSSEPGATVRVTVPGLPPQSTTVDASGSWQVNRSYADGTYTATARATDPTGNEGPPASVTFTVDATPPNPPVIEKPSYGASLPASTVTISGTAEPGSQVTVTETTTIGTVTTGPDGRWGMSATFADGVHTIVARARDAAGHTSAASPAHRFIVDTVAPAVPSVSSPANGSLVAADVLFSGSAEPFAFVEIFHNGFQTTSVAADAYGAWSIRISMSSGAQRLTVRARDAAGNRSAHSPDIVYTVDSDRPFVQIHGPAERFFLPSEQTRITGTASDGFGVSHIELQWYDLGGRHVATRLADCPACPLALQPEWSTNFSPGLGRYVVQAYAVDRVGHRSDVARAGYVRL